MIGYIGHIAKITHIPKILNSPNITHIPKILNIVTLVTGYIVLPHIASIFQIKHYKSP